MVYGTYNYSYSPGTPSEHSWVYVELWLESSVDGTSWPILWRWSNGSTVSSSGSGADLSTSTTSPTAYSIPPTSTTISTHVSSIPINTTNTSATGTRSTGTYGHSSQSTSFFHDLQSWWDAPTDEVHSGIQYSSNGGEDSRTSSPPHSTTKPSRRHVFTSYQPSSFNFTTSTTSTTILSTIPFSSSWISHTETWQTTSLHPSQSTTKTFIKTSQALIEESLLLQFEAQLVPGTSLHGKIVRGPSRSSLLHLHVEVIDNPLRSTINHMTTPPISQLFRLLLGGKANIPPGTTTQRMIPIILSSLPVTSGNRGASGRTTPRIPLPCVNLHGMIPRSLPIAMPPHPMTLPPNHSQHSPPPSQHLHATRKASLTRLEMINLKSPYPYPQDTCSSISGMDQKQNGSGLSSSVSVTKIEWERHRRCHMPTNRSQARPSTSKIFNELWPLCKELIPKSPQRSPEKRSIWFPAPTSSPCLTWSNPSSSIYHRRICWRWFSHFLRSLDSPCHLHSKMPRIIPGRALLHGTPIETAQAILLEGKIRPANWSFNSNLSRCDVPTFGAFYLGREIAKSDTFPEWAAKDLMDTIQKKGKGQQQVIVGAMYRGACAHTAFKAGGNETAQISVADKGVATTSEKYTIAHSNHVGLKFIALKWQNLPAFDDDGDSSSDEYNYRAIHERTEATHSGHRDDHHT